MMVKAIRGPCEDSTKINFHRDEECYIMAQETTQEKKY